MPKCLVFCCKNNSNKLTASSISFFKLTKDRYSSWLRAINRDPNEKVAYTNVICSEHFQDADFHQGFRRKYLKENAVPSLRLRPSHWPERAQTIQTPVIQSVETLEESPAEEESCEMRTTWHIPTPYEHPNDQSPSFELGRLSMKYTLHLVRFLHNYSIDSSPLEDINDNKQVRKVKPKKQGKYLRVRTGLFKSSKERS